jgi:hypothetical protein
MPASEVASMSTNAVVMQGVVKPDGTLQIDGKIPLPAGRVNVTLEPTPSPEETDPFLAMLQRVWEIREQSGVKPEAEAAQAALRQLRDEASEEVAEAGRLQEECQRRRNAVEETGKEAE